MLAKLDEQEIILNYDRLEEVWHVYSDVPAWNKKNIKYLKVERKKMAKNGAIAVLEGTLSDANVRIVKKYKQNLSTEDRQKRADFMRRLGKKNKK